MKPVSTAPAAHPRLSLNQATTEQWSLREAIGGCSRAGIDWIGVWRHKLADLGVARAARMLRENGLRVSSLCRGGFFTGATARERHARQDDNRRALEEARELGAPLLVLVAGGAPDRDLDGARLQVEEGLGALLADARQAGVRLGVEPLHPAFTSDRSVLVTLAQSADLLDRLAAPEVGVVVDTYHVWWDPAVYAGIRRLTGRIASFHISDWPAENRDPLMSRGLMGEGVIELRRLRLAVEAAGYTGPIEVEIFNPALWARPGDEILEAVKEGYLAHVA